MVRAILEGVVAAAGTATLLSSVGWALRRWKRAALVLLPVLLPVIVVTVATSPAYAMTGTFNYAQVWSGHVATSQYYSCEWIKQTIDSGPPPVQGGYPYIATVATVDGGANCSNTGFQAPPGNLSMRQALENTSDGVNIFTCNYGVRIANDGYWTHVISTQFGWFQVPPPCGNTYYRERSINYFFDGTNWVGGQHYGPWIYVQTW